MLKTKNLQNKFPAYNLDNLDNLSVNTPLAWGSGVFLKHIPYGKVNCSDMVQFTGKKTKWQAARSSILRWARALLRLPLFLMSGQTGQALERTPGGRKTNFL